MTITFNFTSIFAWIGGIGCAILTLWILGWIIRGIVGMGEFLGIWDAIGRGARKRVAWVKSKFNRE